MVFSKLGGQSRFGTTNERRTWIANSPIWKALDQTDDLDQAIAAGAFTIWRHYLGGDLSQWQGRDPAQVADEVIDPLGGRMPSCIEGPNEAAPGGYDGMAAYAQWHRGFSARAHQRGHKVCGFNFGTGGPQLRIYDPSSREWQGIADNNFGDVDYIGIHEYWAQGVPLDGPPSNGSCAFRYRLAHAELVSIGHGNHPDFLITECGRDNCQANYNCPGGPGWICQLGSGGGAQFASECHSYDQGISQDGYVKGAVLFISGGGSDFANFEIDGLASILFGGGPPPPTAECVTASDCFNLHGAPLPGNYWTCQNGACVEQVSQVGGGGNGSGGDGATQPLDPLLVVGAVTLIGLAAALVLTGGKGGPPSRALDVADVHRIPHGAPVPPGYVVLG